MNWILIITLITWDGASVHSVHGFSSVDSCKAAYEVYKQSVTDFRPRRTSGACVQQ